MSAAKCEALVSGDWHSFQCRNNGKVERLGRLLCMVHAKQLDKGDDPVGYAAFWWKWKDASA